MSERNELLKWKIPQDKLINWKRLNPDLINKEEAHDCVINSFHLLGVIDDPETAKILSQQHANVGVQNDELLKIIYDKYSNVYDGLKINFKLDKKEPNEIRKKLNNDEYTFVGFTRPDGKEGHAVIITKQNDIFYVYDPQQEKCYQELINLQDWVKENNFNGALFLLKDKISRVRSPSNDSTTSINSTRKNLKKKIKQLKQNMISIKKSSSSSSEKQSTRKRKRKRTKSEKKSSSSSNERPTEKRKLPKKDSNNNGNNIIKNFSKLKISSSSHNI